MCAKCIELMSQLYAQQASCREAKERAIRDARAVRQAQAVQREFERNAAKAEAKASRAQHVQQTDGSIVERVRQLKVGESVTCPLDVKLYRAKQLASQIVNQRHVYECTSTQVGVQITCKERYVSVLVGK